MGSDINRYVQWLAPLPQPTKIISYTHDHSWEDPNGKSEANIRGLSIQTFLDEIIDMTTELLPYHMNL